jgi:hypothetical protein
MADTATGPHVHGLEDCQAPGYHCYWHNADEPGDAFRVCFECHHAFLSAADLLAEHNKVLAGLGLEAETDVERVHCCPECSHNW